MLLGIFALWVFVTKEEYRVIFLATSKGLLTTLYVSGVAYLAATLLGLAVGLMQQSRRRLLREVATFYVEILRGVPMLVILYYIAFIGAPALVSAINWLIGPLIAADLVNAVRVRDLSFVSRAILALTLGYSAFIAEIFRAGIESIHRGQNEAAQALGMSRWQAMRFVVLPQAARNVLPPLGNEFVAMIKDSALVSALGVQDITQIGKVYSSSTFRFFETYNVVAFQYLIMTITLSIVIRMVEQRLQSHRTLSSRI